MRAFAIYLWKEWRDQRAIVLGFLLAAPVLLILLSFVLSSDLVADPLFAGVAAMGAVAVGLLSVGSDLVPGEARRSRLDFLRRLPGGLGLPFAAKLLFLLFALALFGAWGGLVAGLVGTLPGSPDGTLVGIALAAALWVFAVSCWLPRGALALPATGVLFALGAVPVLLIHEATPGLFHLTRAEEPGLLLLLGAGGLLAAWLSFVRGYRFGRGIGAAAWRGLLVTLLVFTPVWARTGQQARAWTHIEPHDAAFRIDSAVVGAGGRFAYVNARMRLPQTWNTPTRALVVDLDTGEWRKAGGLWDWFVPGRNLHPLRVVDLQEYASREPGRVWLHHFDGTTGERIKGGWSDMRLPEVEALRGDVSGDTHPCGLGWHVPGGIHDPFRQATFRRPADFSSVSVRPGRWLVRRVRTGCLLYDPETGETEPARGLPKRLGPFQLLPDGRVVFADRAIRELIACNPESGERRTLLTPVARAWGHGRTAAGALVMSVDQDGRMRLARLEPGTLTLRFAPQVEPFATLDEDTLIGRMGRSLVRVRFGSPGVEILFPR